MKRSKDFLIKDILEYSAMIQEYTIFRGEI